MEDKKTKKSKVLGRGLNALFDTADFLETPLKENIKVEESGESVKVLKLRDIEPNKNQPRKTFDKDKLETLAESLKNHGVVQPILVKKEKNDIYTIIAGERRWRAAKLAGLKEIPCIVKEFDEKELMEIALIENLQREDLNPIEEAEGYKNLMDTFNMRQEEVAQRVGKSRSAIANSLRLNNLCNKVKQMVVKGEISQGHARTLITITDEKSQIMLAERIVKESLNVRETEKMVALFEKGEETVKENNAFKVSPAMKKYYSEIEKNLSNKFNTKVKINPGKNKSKIEIEYYSKEDLERLLFELK